MPRHSFRLKFLESGELHDKFFNDFVRLGYFNLTHACKRVPVHSTTEYDRALDEHVSDLLPDSI